MKANELRINNYVYLKHEDDENEVLKFDFEMGWNFDFIEPIPLTKEWLLKFGFEKEDEFLELQINDDISIIWVGYLSIMIQGTIGFMYESELIYVHQLQNLYFALIGEELVLKSKYINDTSK